MSSLKKKKGTPYARDFESRQHAFGMFSIIWHRKSSEMHSYMYVYTYVYFFEKLLVTASHFGLLPFLQSKLLHSTKDFPYKVKEAC